MNLRYTDRSKDDIELAFAWYERQRRGLGFEFLDCVESFFRNIIKNPEMHQIRYSCFRGCPYGGFLSQYFTQLKLMKLWFILYSTIDKTQGKGLNKALDQTPRRSRFS